MWQGPGTRFFVRSSFFCGGEPWKAFLVPNTMKLSPHPKFLTTSGYVRFTWVVPIMWTERTMTTTQHVFPVTEFVIFLMVSFWLVSHSNHWQVCDTSVSQTDPHPHVMTPLSLPPFREGEDIGRGKGRQGRNDPPLSFQRRRFHPDNVGNSCSTLLVTYPKPVTHLRLFWLKNKEHVRLPVIKSHTTKYTLCITVYLFYPQLQCSHCSARAIPFSTTNYSWY